jgi:hypothetical protein
MIIKKNEVCIFFLCHPLDTINFLRAPPVNKQCNPSFVNTLINLQINPPKTFNNRGMISLKPQSTSSIGEIANEEDLSRSNSFLALSLSLSLGQGKIKQDQGGKWAKDYQYRTPY